MWPWESALTGFGEYESNDDNEIHISGDVANAFRLFYRMTKNQTWLRNTGWPVIRGSADFFASRAVPCDNSSCTLGGQGGATTRNLTYLSVVSPDESAGRHDSSAYTNGIAITVLDFALEAAQLLGETPSANWSSVSERLYLPIINVPAGFMAGTPVHTEYHGYDQKSRPHINQADVTLLQYPLGLRSNKRIFPPLPNSKNPDTQLAINDLLFWQPKSDNQIFYTGDSSNSIAWLEMGNRSAADAQFDLAFTHMDLEHFNVFEERNTGNFGHLNFITGAGGYLQNVVNGYLGLRYTPEGLNMRPVLPPHGVKSVKLRALSLAGSRMDMLLSSESLTVTLVEGPAVTVKSQGAPDAKLMPGHPSATVKLCKSCGCGCPGGGCGCFSVLPTAPSSAAAKTDDSDQGRPVPSFWHAGWGFISHGGFPPLPASWSANATDGKLSRSVVSYFLGNTTGMNNAAELEAQAKFGIVGIGWQLNQVEPGKLEQYEVETAKALKALRPDIKVMVSRNTEAAAYFWDSCRERMTDPATQDFWTQCRGKPCAQDWSAPGSRNHSSTVTPGFYYNYSNAKLVDWWANEYIGNALKNPLIDGVYYDCACIPEPGVRDQMQMQAPAQAAFDKALALIEGSGKWTSSWWGGMLPQPAAEDSSLVDGGRTMLGHVHYCNLTMRSWITEGQNDSNTLQILAPGFSGTKPHTKGPSDTRAENNTIAAFLIARGKNAVISLLPNENGWSLASDYGWSELFDMDFGAPLGPAVESPANVFTRKYSKISPIVLDCNTGTSTFGSSSSAATAKTDDVGEDVAPPVTMPSAAELAAALARSDMVWAWNVSERASVPTLWTEGPFVGNGMVGAYITAAADGSALLIEVARADYWDVRLPGTEFFQDRCYLDTPRLPAGYLTLKPPAGSTIVGGSARVVLFNASLSMSLELDAGGGAARTLTLDAVALADRPSELLFEGSALHGLSLNWHARPANGARGVDPHPNPAATCEPAVGDTVMCKQDLLAGGGFAMARKLSCAGGGSCSLLMSLTNSVPAGVRSKSDAATLARTALTAAATAGAPALKAAHAAWWADFWSQSFMSVPDPIVEAFHAIQLYKVASATRCDGPENCWAMDLAMTWYVPIGRWHDYHWDLNVQMSYWLVLPSNHAELGNSLVAQMKRNLPWLIKSVPPQYQNDSAAQAANTGWEGRSSCDAFLLSNTTTADGWDCFEHGPAASAADEDGRDGKGAGAVQYGDLPWVAHNLWWQYRYTLDAETLDVCVSVLKRAVGYYMRLMTTNGTTLHLPLAESPEYASAVDTNYDLSLFRWGVGVLLHVADTLQPALKAEPAYARWKSVAATLTPFPVGESGLLIGQDVALTHGHRHWSHLFSMFPTTLLNPGASAAGANADAAPSPLHSDLAEKSLDHYATMNGAEKFRPTIQNGFPRVAISTMSGMAGRSEGAYGNLSVWFASTSAANEGYGGGSMGVNLGPNTMYQEAGGAPCNESPLGAAFAIQSWLLSSFSFGPPETSLQADTIRVFPSVPSQWTSDISIGNMAAEGGYNVSASYKQGKTVWVHVAATEKGGPRSVLLYTDMAAPLVVQPASIAAKFLRTEGHQNVYSLSMQPAAAVLLQPSGATPLRSAKVSAVQWPKLAGVEIENWWGKHKRQAFPPMPPPPPAPPPPGPPPPPVTCEEQSVPGYTCFAARCAYDGGHRPHAGQCGGDICHPLGKAAEADPATAALCKLVPEANATQEAAARCDAFKGCTTFARCPKYTPQHCAAAEPSVAGASGVCFKFFSSGEGGLVANAGWTAWTKKQ